MARFRGTVQGSRGEASRLGDSKNGLGTTCNGWKLGAYCTMAAVTCDGEDIDQLEVTITQGSARASASFGGFTVQRAGERGVIRPDRTFLQNIAPLEVAAALALNPPPETVEMVADILLQNETWAKVLRAKLWMTGKAYEEPAA
jgi:hypothetical protein